MKTTLLRKASAQSLWATALLLTLVVGCSSPLLLTRLKENTGTLSVSVPHLATWVSDQLKAQPGGSRAYVIADAIKVEVKNSEGADVIAPVTVTLAFGTDYSPAAAKVMSDINDIPAGTDYTVVISIYNHAVSTTEPQVQGEASGVTVTNGAVTPVSVVCKPVNPIPLTIDGGYDIAPSAPNGERWYVANLVEGQSYYVDSYTATAFFDQNGLMITPFNVPHIATYTGPIYIVVVDFNGFAGFVARGETKILLSTTQPVINEGSVEQPLELTVDSDHEFKLSGSSLNAPSFYTFTATDTGTYVFDSEFYDISYQLYTDSTFTGTPIASGSSVPLGGSLGLLTAGTDYYLRLTNPSSSSNRKMGRVMTPVSVAATSLSEGTSGSPVELALGTTETGTVGFHAFDTTSYYSFTTDDNGHTDIAFTVPSPTDTTVQVKLNDAPTTPDGTYDFSINTATNDHIYAQLQPNKTYYLLVTNDRYTGAQRDKSVSYAITVTTSSSQPPEANEGTLASPQLLTLNTEHTFRVGAYGSGYNTSYYQFETTDAGNYALDLEGGGLSAYVYSDSNFSTEVASLTDGYGGEIFGLSASTVYYLKLSNSSGSRMLTTGQILDASTMAPLRVNDGTLASPYLLTLGSPRAGTVGKHSFDSTSYYRFETGDDIDYKISAIVGDGRTLVTLATDQSLFGVLNTFYLSKSSPVTEALLPHTVYYMKVRNMMMYSNSTVSYTIQVDAVSPPTFIPLPVQASYTAGSIDVPRSMVWYEADVVGGESYLLSATGGTLGATRFGAFEADRATPYFRDYGTYNSPVTVNVPAGQTKLYVRVRAPNGYTDTGTFNLKLELAP